MADEHDSEMIERGVEAWNAWRRTDPSHNPDLSEADLHWRDLPEIDLHGADISKALLYGAKMPKADLSGANLQQANLSAIDLSGARLPAANLTGANVSGATATEAVLPRANLSGANLSGADLSGANLAGANLSGACLAMANLSGAKLGGADLSDSDLFEADLTGADLAEVDFSRAIVRGVQYDRRKMLGCYIGIRGIESCYGDPIFRRDAMDQDFIDAMASRSKHGWRRLLFAAWGRFDYGRSLRAVALWAIAIVMLFALLYCGFPHWIQDGRHNERIVGEVSNSHIVAEIAGDTKLRTPFTPFYFSIVTFTTLGFGDVSPTCLAGEIAVVLEVVFGYLTLGLLLAILSNVVARRS